MKIDELLISEEGDKEVLKIREDIKAEKKKDEEKTEERPEERPEDEEGEGEVPHRISDLKGCTSNVMLVKNGEIYVANAGDSRTIAVLQDGKVEDLSIDHKPDREPEHTRVTKAGGSVVNGRVEGNLSLSRALGDLHYKVNKEKEQKDQIISAYPDITVRPLTKNIRYIVMGCDGVYEMQTSQFIGTFVTKGLKDDPGNLKKVACDLLDNLISKDCIKSAGIGCDNMTCILIEFKHP